MVTLALHIVSCAVCDGSRELRAQCGDWTRQESDALVSNTTGLLLSPIGIGLREFRVQFDSMDLNGDGVISPHEFYQNCRRKLSANAATFDAALKEHQVILTLCARGLIGSCGQDVFLDLSELDEVAGVVERLRLEQAKELVRAFQLFDMYDKDHNGVIDRDEYWEVR